MTLCQQVTVDTLYSHDWVLVNTKFFSIIRGWIKKHSQEKTLVCLVVMMQWIHLHCALSVSSIEILPLICRYSKLALWFTYILGCWYVLSSTRKETSSEARQECAWFQQNREASCHQVSFPGRQGTEGNSHHSDRNISLFPSWSG